MGAGLGGGGGYFGPKVRDRGEFSKCIIIAKWKEIDVVTTGH